VASCVFSLPASERQAEASNSLAHCRCSAHHKRPSSMIMAIAAQYFFEELATTLGSAKAEDWLRTSAEHYATTERFDGTESRASIYSAPERWDDATDEEDPSMSGQVFLSGAALLQAHCSSNEYYVQGVSGDRIRARLLEKMKAWLSKIPDDYFMPLTAQEEPHLDEREARFTADQKCRSKMGNVDLTVVCRDYESARTWTCLRKPGNGRARDSGRITKSFRL
jgi:hypothetical protein